MTAEAGEQAAPADATPATPPPQVPGARPAAPVASRRSTNVAPGLSGVSAPERAAASGEAAETRTAGGSGRNSGPAEPDRAETAEPSPDAGQDIAARPEITTRSEAAVPVAQPPAVEAALPAARPDAPSTPAISVESGALAPASIGPAPSHGSAAPDLQLRSNVQASAAVPLAAVPIEIGLRALSGASRFDIRLTPDDLGRIDVKLDIDRDGRVDASLVVDRPDTLAFLQRDRGHLERVFEQAGLKPGDNGVSVSLRDGSADGGGSRGQGGGDGGSPRPQPYSPRTTDEAATDAFATAPIRRLTLSRSAGVDLRI